MGIVYSNCANCGGEVAADLLEANRRLNDKFSALGQILTAYMREAPLDRALRNAHAHNLSIIAERIIGGSVVNTGYEECCLIGEAFPNGTMRWFCTGVLVHPQIVLTAGHCHQPPRINASVVALNCTDMNALALAEIVPVKVSASNPLYPQTGRSDITAIILKTPAVTPPSLLATTEELINSTDLTLVGFGNSDPHGTKGFGIKRKVEVAILGMRRSPSDNLDAEELQYGFESDVEVIAGGDGFDSCNGDSGGPGYVVDTSGQFKAAVLTSRAFRSAPQSCGGGGIYTRIDKHLEFVNTVGAPYGVELRL